MLPTAMEVRVMNLNEGSKMREGQDCTIFIKTNQLKLSPRAKLTVKIPAK